MLSMLHACLNYFLIFLGEDCMRSTSHGNVPKEDVEKSKENREDTNAQNMSQGNKVQTGSEAAHQIPLTIAIDLTSQTLPAESADSPASPLPTSDELNEKLDFFPPAATYRRGTKLIVSPFFSDRGSDAERSESEPLLGRLASRSSIAVSEISVSKISAAPIQRKPMKKISDVKAIFDLTPEQAHQALSTHCQESKEPESEKQQRVRSFIACEIRGAFLQSYNYLHHQIRGNGMLPESMQQSAMLLINRYAQVKEEWEQTIGEINQELIKTKDITVEDKSYNWLLHYYEQLSQNGTSNNDASHIYNELKAFEKFENYEEGLSIKTDHELDAQYPTLMQDWLTVLNDASLTMIEEQKPQSSLLVARQAATPAEMPVYFSPEEIEAYFKEKDKREQAVNDDYTRDALYTRLLELKGKREKVEKEIHYREKRLTNLYDTRENYVKSVNQKLKDNGAFETNLSGNELLMHFQRLYFEERSKVSGSSTQVGYARRGVPEKDRRYQRLIAAKRKLAHMEMQLDEYCYSSETQRAYLAERLKKEGELDLLTEDHSRPVDEVETYMMQKGQLKSPPKRTIPLPSMLDALAEHAGKTVWVWTKKAEGSQELQPVHYYVPTQASNAVIHVLREGDTYQPLHEEKGNDIVITLGSADSERSHDTQGVEVRHFRGFKLHAYQDDQGRRYSYKEYDAQVSPDPTEEEVDQSVSSLESYKVDPAYLDMCRWRDRFFWEAVVALNKAIKKDSGHQADDALHLLGLLLGDNSAKVQEESQALSQEHLFELVYQKTFLKLMKTIQTTLTLHGEQQREERCFTQYQREMREPTAIYAKEVQENKQWIEELSHKLMTAKSLLDQPQLETTNKNCQAQSHALLQCDAEILALEEQLNLLSFADYEKSPLRSKREEIQSRRKAAQDAIAAQSKEYLSVVLLQSQLALAEQWKQKWGGKFSAWLEKEETDIKRMQEKYRELWNIYEPKDFAGRPVADYDSASGKAGANEYRDILNNEDHARYGYHHLAAAIYARVMKHVPFARPPQNHLSVSERQQTLSELMRQINIAIALSLTGLEHELEHVMSRFQIAMHYSFSDTVKHTNTVHSIAEQHMERLKHWAMHFLQGNLDDRSAHGAYVAQFGSEGDLDDFVNSMSQSIAAAESDVALLAQKTYTFPKRSRDDQMSAVQAYLAESSEWVSQKSKLLPFYYQGHGDQARSPKQMIRDIQSTHIGSRALAQIALQDTGDTLMHFALLAYNKVEGKQKERLFNIIAMLFARGADSNIKNIHTKPQTARQLAKLKLTVPADLQFVTMELKHQKPHNDFEADVANKMMQYCRETYSRFLGRGFLERLLFIFKRSEKEIQKRRVRDVQVITEMLHDSRHKLDDTELNKLLQFMLQNEEARFVHRGELQAKIHSTVANVNTPASGMTYYGPFMHSKLDMKQQLGGGVENQKQEQGQGAGEEKQNTAEEKQNTAKEEQSTEKEKQIAVAANRVSDQADERLVRLQQQLDAARRTSENMHREITRRRTDVSRRLTEAEGQVLSEMENKASEYKGLADKLESLVILHERRSHASNSSTEALRARGLFSNSSSSSGNITVPSVESSAIDGRKPKIESGKTPELR